MRSLATEPRFNVAFPVEPRKLACRRSGSPLPTLPLKRFVFDIFFAPGLQNPLTTTS